MNAARAATSVQWRLLLERLPVRLSRRAVNVVRGAALPLLVQYAAANGAYYPVTVFGRRLRQIVQPVKSDVGLEIAFADIGG